MSPQPLLLSLSLQDTELCLIYLDHKDIVLEEDLLLNHTISVSGVEGLTIQGRGNTNTGGGGGAPPLVLLVQLTTVSESTVVISQTTMPAVEVLSSSCPAPLRTE